MSLRVIVRTTDVGDACNVGGASVHETYDTFLIEAPDLEWFLRANVNAGSSTPYVTRRAVGIELADR